MPEVQPFDGPMSVLLGRRERQETGESTLPPQFEARF